MAQETVQASLVDSDGQDGDWQTIVLVTNPNRYFPVCIYQPLIEHTGNFDLVVCRSIQGEFIADLIYHIYFSELHLIFLLP